MHSRKKPQQVIKLLSLCAALLLPVSATFATTEFRFEQNTNTKSVSEGYSGNLDILLQEREEARHASALAAANQNRVQTEDATGGPLTAHPYRFPQIYLNHDHDHVYIVSVGTSVYSDADQDGFFSKFSLRFDADTAYGEEDVYAQIYLRNDGDNYELFHTSRVFEVYESLGSDEYELDSRLVSNYPAGYYDIRVELRDAYDDELYDMVDASSHRTLSGLPLESSELNGVNTQSLDLVDGDLVDGRREQIISEQIGASFILLPLLFAMALVRRRRT